MCFFGSKKPEKIKLPEAKPTPTTVTKVPTPIEPAVPEVQSGTTQANAERQKKRPQAGALSLFEIRLNIPGATTSSNDTPGPAIG